MIEGEILGREVAHPADQQGQGIAHGHERGRARRGASPSGQASSIGPSAMQRSAAWPSELVDAFGDRDQAGTQPP